MSASAGDALQRLRITARGRVQGVGFRPWVHRVARELNLPGWVRNAGGELEIEVEGHAGTLDAFMARLARSPPPQAEIDTIAGERLLPRGFAGFEIRASVTTGDAALAVPPDIATCEPCLREILDPRDRRYRHPFTSCADCGPRYTVLTGMPYDRARTTLGDFALCAACATEYADPADRRFHAQSIACPACGPQLALRDRDGRVRATRDAALRAAGAALVAGRILALKGIGGYQLLCDATDEAAVTRLRAAKRRPHKPFALLVPTLAAARRIAHVSEAEAALLAGAPAPIVLLRRRGDTVATAVAPDSPLLGIMLPCSPLHHLLARDTGRPLVATSGNRAEEPIAIDDGDAQARLHDIADLFLVHDRPIARRADDSVVRVIADVPTVLRRARGHAPAVVARAPPVPVLALGGHLKSSIALVAGNGIVLGAHGGDLDDARARDAFVHGITDLRALCAAHPGRVACDAHPDYASSLHAPSLGLPVVRVPHHFAHVLSCLADNGADGPVLGVVFDGAGLGSDGTLWGGEFLAVDGLAWERVAHLRPFPLPGGERALREPRRAALGLALACGGGPVPPEIARLFTAPELAALESMVAAGVNSPLTSSVGRLFDAVAALTGCARALSFEGQAAIGLEHLAGGAATDVEPYPLPLRGRVLDPAPLLEAVFVDLRTAVPLPRLAARFHAALAAAVVAVARATGHARLALSGGCFQNAELTARVVAAAGAAGCEVLRHRHVPPNDGGLALGQAVAAGHA